MQINNGQFWQGDCLELMRDIPDGSVDMVVTSPPYDNLRTYNGMPAFTFDVFRPIADQLSRVIKPGGVIVWNVADATVNGSETGSSFRQALYFKDGCGLNLHDTMIYAKKNYVPLTHNRYEQSWEYMFVLSKGRPKTFNGIKIPSAQTPGGKTWFEADGSKRDRHSPRGIKTEKLKSNIWEYSIGQAKTGHPAVFPMQLPVDHILSWSNPGELVLDPFGGSGTTAVAAERTGRKWILIERDPDYYLQACARVIDTPAN